MRLIYPLLAQILWTFIVLVLAGRARAAVVAGGQIKLRQIALGNDAWPDKVRAFGNNMNNQFETPVLFYALVGAAIYTGATSYAMLAFAWGYVISRVAHTLVHTGSNNVIMRFRIFLAGVLLLMAMWAGVVLKLLGVL